MSKAFLKVSCLAKFSLIVNAGDRVLKGQPIARHVNDNILEAQRAAVGKAILIVQASSAEIRSLRVTFATTKPALERKLLDATRTVSQLEYLAGAGAEPPIKLAQARASLHDLEAHRIEALSSCTSREATLERAVQQANLTVKGARAARSAVLERQWVRSPLAGFVSEVRVKSVTAKGITLEVMLLEAKVGKGRRL